jgi:hypothetical protein
VELELHANLPLLVRHLKDIEPGDGACDIEQRVNPAKAVKRFLDDDCGGRRRHQIQLDRKRLGADRCYLVSDFAQLLAVARSQNDSRKIARQTKSRRLAYARACAGYDRYCVCHVLTPFV